MSTRSEFLAATAVAAVAPLLPSFSGGMQKPPILRRGQRVGLIAPASPPTGDDVGRSIANVESIGLVPVLGKHVNDRNGYLAGSDEDRAADFNAMARDPNVRAIVAIRGGYGTMRILPKLDYAALERDPKIVMGYSDFTAVLNAVAVHSRLITFHGPVGAHGSSWTGAARGYLEAALFAAEPIRLRVGSSRPVVAGHARGRLAGGNLSLVAALAGTPFAVPTAGSILFLEETEEPPYRIDRMLTQLDLAGQLAAARAFLIGRCTKCVGPAPTQSAEQVIDERLRGLGLPAVAGAPIGHIGTQWVLPIGARAELDADAGILSTLEAACSRPRASL
ncbi:MAG: LD-carboxypeptidase [Candidatus Eremiobacteraeota bacterium]|nr:LD-carboxypeptidase [Candidatus Eremiobacteraeota bacterium]